MIENVNTNFTELNDAELKLLCFLAYHGEDFSISSGAEYRKHVRVSKKTYDEAIAKLNECGFIQGKSYVKPIWHIRVLKELYSNHSEWIEKFKNIGSFSRNSVAEYLCNIVKLILSGDYAGASNVRRPYIGLGYKQFNLLNYLQSATEEDLRFMKMLNDYEMRDMVSEVLNTFFTKDEISKDILDMLRRMINDENKFKNDLLGEINAYEPTLKSTVCLKYLYFTKNNP